MAQQRVNPVEENVVTDNITSIDKENNIRGDMNLGAVTPPVEEDSTVDMQMAQVVPPNIVKPEEEKVVPVRDEERVVEEIAEEVDTGPVDATFERTGIRTEDDYNILRPLETKEQKAVRIEEKAKERAVKAGEARADSLLAREFRDNVTTEPIMDEEGRVLGYQVYLEDVDGELLDAITYSLQDYSEKEITNMVDKAKERVNRLDLTDLKSAPGQNATVTRRATEGILRSAITSPVGYAIARGVMSANPARLGIGATAIAWNILDPFGTGSLDLPEVEGMISGVEKGEIALKEFYNDLTNGAVGEIAGDGKGGIDPMTIETISGLLDRKSQLPWALRVMNMLAAEVPLVVGYRTGVLRNKKFINELTNQALAIGRVVKRNNLAKAVDKNGNRLYTPKRIDEIMGGNKNNYNSKKEKHMPGFEANADDVSRRLGLWLKKKNVKDFKGKTWFQKLEMFKRDQIFQFSQNAAEANKNLFGGEAIFYTTSIGLDTLVGDGFGIGTFSNTAVALTSDIFSNKVSRAAVGSVRGVNSLLAGTVDRITMSYTQRTDDQAWRAASARLSDGSQGGFENIAQERARQYAREEGLPADDYTELHLADARKDIMDDFRGGTQMFGDIAKWLNGKSSLEDLNLSEAQKTGALKFMENFKQLSPDSQERLISQMDRAQTVYTSLEKMGLKDPDKGFGLIFGLNTLRAIEPDILQQGLQAANLFERKAKGKFFHQIELEEFYLKKNAYAVALEEYLKEVLVGVNKNFKTTKGTAEFIQNDLKDHIDEVKEMISTIKIEQAGATEVMGDMIEFTLAEANGLVNNSPMAQANVKEYLRIIKIQNPDLALSMQTKIEKAYRRTTANLSKGIDQARDIRSRREATGRSIGARLQNQQAILQNKKDTAYDIAKDELKDFEPVDGTDLFFDMRKALDEEPVSEGVRQAGIGGIINPINEIWGEVAENFFKKLQGDAGLETKQSLDKVLREQLRNTQEIGTDEINDLMSNPVKLMSYIIENKLPVGGEIPKFLLSATDLKNVQQGLKQYVRKNQAGDSTANYQSIKADNVLAKVNEQVEASGLNTDAYAEADEIATRFWEFKSTNIYQKTLGTRQRYFNLEDKWEYGNSIERWGDIILDNPKNTSQVYREVKRMFVGDPEGLKLFIKDLNKQALTLITDDISKIGADDLGLFKDVKVKGGKGERLVKRDAEVEGSGLKPEELKNITKEKLALIRLMEKNSDGMFNFEEAYNFNRKYQQWIKADTDALIKMKELDALRKVGNDQFKSMHSEAWKQMSKDLDGELKMFEEFRDNPQKILDSLQSGNLSNFKNQYLALYKSRGLSSRAAEKKFNKAVHGLFVDGFVSSFVMPTGQLKVTGDNIVGKTGGQFETVGELSGQSTLQFLDKNEKMIKEFLPEVNVKAFREIAEAISLKEAGKFVNPAGVQDITKGLPALTVGSYVSRLYAVSSGRTSLKYVGAEAMVVQMKRQEIAVIATLMMSPGASQRIAELIRSGKAISTDLMASEASWLPKFIGQVDAMHEMMFGDEEPQGKEGSVMEEPLSQASIPSMLPQQTAMLDTMQQTLGG